MIIYLYLISYYLNKHNIPMRTAKQRLEEEPILEAEEEGALVGLNVMPLKSGSIAAVDGDLDSEGTKLGISD